MCRSGWPRGFGELNPSPHSPPEYLLPSQWVPVLFPTYSFCGHCLQYTQVWHRAYPAIWDAPLSRSTRRSLLRYRNRAEITVPVCVKRSHIHYYIWVSCWRKSYSVYSMWSLVWPALLCDIIFGKKINKKLSQCLLICFPSYVRFEVFLMLAKAGKSS